MDKETRTTVIAIEEMLLKMDGGNLGRIYYERGPEAFTTAAKYLGLPDAEIDSCDTEPAWSPNGRHLVFTSDRSGRPHIFRISAAGGPVQRLTKEGREIAGASYDQKGKHLVMVTNQGNGDQIGVFYTGNNELKLLTDGPLDDSPTYSPNGAMIMYATQRGNQGVLAAVSVDGRIKQILRLHQGEVREPAWSFRKQ